MKKIKVIKEPFDGHGRTKEKNLPFIRAGRVLVSDPALKSLFAGREYTGANELGELQESGGYVNVEEVLKVLILELAKTQALLKAQGPDSDEADTEN
jgi:hypothetical protein